MLTSITRLLVVAALALLPGCLATAPRVEIVADHGTVYAESQQVAAQTAADLDRLYPLIADQLVDVHPADPDIWVQTELSLFSMVDVHESVGGFNLSRHSWLYSFVGDRIHVEDSRPERRSLFLAHELVHCLLGESWHTLPPPVEEGLCDAIATSLEPADGVRHRGVLALAAHLALGGLTLEVAYPRADGGRRTILLRGDMARMDPLVELDAGPESVKGADGLDGMKRRGLGFLVAERIVRSGDTAALQAACERSMAEGLHAVPGWQLAEMAGLGVAPQPWLDAAGDLVGEGELAAIADEVALELARRIVNHVRVDHPEVDADTLLDTVPVTLRLHGADAEVDLGTRESVREAVGVVWDD